MSEEVVILLLPTRELTVEKENLRVILFVDRVFFLDKKSYSIRQV